MVNSYLNSKYAVVTNVPAVPTNLTATALSGTQVSLTWAGGATNSSTRFQVERKTGAGGTYGFVAEVTDATAYVDTNLVSSTAYYYRVKALNFVGASDYSSEAGVTTLASGMANMPLGDLKLWLKADGGAVLQNSNIVGSWLDQSGNYFDASQVTVGARPQLVMGAVNGRPAVRFDGVDDYFTLPNVLAGTTQAQVFVVLKAAVDMPVANRALWYFSASATSGRYPATDGTISEAFGSSVLRNIGNPVQPLDAYHLYDVSSQTNDWSARVNGVLQSRSLVNTYSFQTSLALGYNFNTAYFAGDVAELMIFNRVLSVSEREVVNSYLNSKYAVVTNVPAVPAGLAAYAIGTNQVNLGWTNALGNETTIYTVERKTGAGGTYAVVAEVRDTTSYLDGGVSAGTLYYYRVKARNYAGESAYSSEASVTTPSSGVSLPVADLKLWLKADAGVVRNGTNGTVAFWLDQSGNGSDAHQIPTAASQPLLVNNVLNGKPAVRFYGTNFLNMQNFLTGLTQAEAYVVVKAATNLPSANRGLWQFGSATSATYPNTAGVLSEGFGRSSLLNPIGTPAERIDQFHLYNVESQVGLWNSRVNGKTLYTTAANATVNWTTAPYLGQNANGGNRFDGDIAEVLLFNRVLSVAERETVGVYLTFKYGLQQFMLDVLPPLAPTNLVAAGVSSSALDVRWNASSTNALSFQVERKVGAGGVYQTLAFTDGSVTNLLDVTANAATNNYYRVQARNYFGQSYGSEISPPSASILTPSNSAVLIVGKTNLITTYSTDTDGTVSKVELFLKTNIISTQLSSPFSFNWIAQGPGSYILTTKTYDNQGNSQYSTAVTVQAAFDTDDDGIVNDLEVVAGTDPTKIDTDGDGVPDNLDAFPLDPTRSTIPANNPSDTTAPTITLDEPTSATLLP